MTDLRAALAGRPHRGARVIGDRDPGHLVVQELGVARGHEREHAGRSGTGTPPGPNRRRASSSIASTCSTRVERLGHDQVGAGGELAFEAVPLGRYVGRGGIEHTGDREPGALADRPAEGVVREIEPSEDLDQPDQIDVPHPVPVG